ncbi:MAG: hypothetical protein L7S63_09365, partial [Flavobacteriales bacterium]|nr:hypothetical protein [Flavobacteriales bacterium]
FARFAGAPGGGAPAAPPRAGAVRAMNWYGGGTEAADLFTARPPGRAEAFTARPAGSGGPPAGAQWLYAAGNRRLGHPDPTGKVTSYRENRAAVDGVVYDDRPYSFAPDSENAYAHLYHDPRARGPAMFSADYTAYLGPNPQIPQITEGFGGPRPWSGPPGPFFPAAGFFHPFCLVLLLFCVIQLLAMKILVCGSESRLALRIEKTGCRRAPT